MNDQEGQKAAVESQTDDEISIEPGSIGSGRGRRWRRTRSAGTEASVNMDELRELIQLIRENDFTEFELEREAFRVRFRRGGNAGSNEVRSGAFDSSQESAGSAPGSQQRSEAIGKASAPSHPGAKAETAASEDQNLHMIVSPIVGTFYRAASPNSDSFVKIGSPVEPDTVVCIIEAMKLMNEIQAETSGEVAKIYVENGQPVEYGQPLFGIKK
ncbi:MAG: acetyl-CoA carboxylase biotin carboxyl carrier protein [Acidobacteriota bacterium]|nr:acetyl-CoA carboxylase biotin carboxyl carrier protein [Acidobacteriota bacterium]